jgi:hypothetical protein
MRSSLCEERRKESKLVLIKKEERASVYEGRRREKRVCVSGGRKESECTGVEEEKQLHTAHPSCLPSYRENQADRERKKQREKHATN